MWYAVFSHIHIVSIITIIIIINKNAFSVEQKAEFMTDASVKISVSELLWFIFEKKWKDDQKLKFKRSFKKNTVTVTKTFDNQLFLKYRNATC